VIYLHVEDVIDFHTEVINVFGGRHGIRDLGLLISAVEMPKASMLGEDFHKTIFDKATAYLFHIICNHPFIDGNERSGTVAALTFLEVNAVSLECNSKKLEELVISVAKGQTRKEEIAHFFKDYSQKRSSQ